MENTRYMDHMSASHQEYVCIQNMYVRSKPVFLNRWAAARYRARASIIPGRERPEETTISHKILLV